MAPSLRGGTGHRQPSLDDHDMLERTRYSFHHVGIFAHRVTGRLIHCRGDRFAASCDVMLHQRCGTVT